MGEYSKNYYKFVNWDVAPFETVKNWQIAQMLDEAEAGDKSRLFEAYKGKALRDKQIRIGGWSFNVGQYLNRYWVNVKHYGIRQYYAVNKTSIREAIGSHNILEIVQVSR